MLTVFIIVGWRFFVLICNFNVESPKLSVSSGSRPFHGIQCVIGEGNGTPLQYSCLENPIDGGAWWAAVHGVTRSRTQLSDFTFTFTFMHWRRKWQPTPVFLPGESQGGVAWWAAVYGVAQSRTRLKRLSSSSSKQPFHCFYRDMLTNYKLPTLLAAWASSWPTGFLFNLVLLPREGAEDRKSLALR